MTEMIFILFFCYLGPRTITQSYAVDTQSENTSENDLQSSTAELPEVPVQILHRPGAGAASTRLARLSHVQHAGGGQQRQGQRSVPGLRARLPVEATKPRSPRPFDGVEASPSVV